VQASLDQILGQAKVCGSGVLATLFGAPPDGRREITKDEWSSRTVNVRRGTLDTPAGGSFEHRPEIKDVLVTVADLRRAVAAEAEIAKQAAGPDLADLVRKAIAEGRTQSDIVKNPPSGATRKKIRNLWTSLGGSTKPGPRGPRNNRAATTA
jgi:hypothetical protein